MQTKYNHDAVIQLLLVLSRMSDEQNTCLTKKNFAHRSPVVFLTEADIRGHEIWTDHLAQKKLSSKFIKGDFSTIVFDPKLGSTRNTHYKRIDENRNNPGGMSCGAWRVFKRMCGKQQSHLVA